MRLLKVLFLSFFGFCYLVQVSEAQKKTVPPSHLQEVHGVISLKPISTPKQTYKLPPPANPRKPIHQKPNLVQQTKLIQRRDIPFQQTFLGVPVQIENVRAQAPAGNLYPQLPKLPPVKPVIKPNETEAERAERIHKSFERLLTFVEIVGQVDNYVSSKWKNLVKTVSNFYENEDEPYRLTSKRIYGPCPHVQ